jgi:hypothetical protein
MNRWAFLSLLAMSCGSSFEGSSSSSAETIEAGTVEASSEPLSTTAEASSEVAPAERDGGSLEAAPPPPSCPDVWERECMPDAAVVACGGRCGLCPRLGVQVCLPK